MLRDQRETVPDDLQSWAPLGNRGERMPRRAQVFEPRESKGFFLPPEEMHVVREDSGHGGGGHPEAAVSNEGNFAQDSHLQPSVCTSPLRSFKGYLGSMPAPPFQRFWFHSLCFRAPEATGLITIDLW